MGAVIIIDDEPLSRSLACRAARTVVRDDRIVALDAVEASKHFAADSALPGGRGEAAVVLLGSGEYTLEVLRKLRSNPSTAGVPVFVVGLAVGYASDRYLDAGATGCWVRPASVKEYEEVIGARIANALRDTSYRLGEDGPPSPGGESKEDEVSKMAATSCTALVVDDEPDDLLLTLRALKAIGNVHIHFASDAFDAARLLGLEGNEPSRELPDFVLLDVKLPGRNGPALLRMIRSNERTKDIPVFMLSNSSEPRDVDECMRSGANDYWVKATDYYEHIGELERLIRSVVLKLCTPGA